MTTHLEFTSKLALQAGNLLLEHFQRADLAISRKADQSIVTQADLASDRLIAEAIHREYPQDFILSEELQTSLAQDASVIWIVDPLDGTTNYTLGLHVWGVSIARLIDHRPQLAIIYFPLLDELYTAELGRGAFLNGKPIHVRPPHPDHPLPFFACCSRAHRRYQIQIPYKYRILGSSAYTYCMVARGTAILGFEVTPKIWDLAAAWLIVEEAGGFIEPFSGSSPFPIQQGHEYVHQSFTCLAAASQELLAEAHEKIQLKQASPLAPPPEA
ncbi:MAG: hypothetical protein JW726_10220 [Anaerolineales bacterium]|nr:hypothetical protein [Anaerolineales bacterium]